MTLKDIDARVRSILNDTADPNRWTPEVVRRGVVDGVRRLHALNPATRYVDGVLMDEVDVPDVTDSNDEIMINDRYLEALVHYAVYHCYTYDDPDTANGELANLNLQKAERLMVS